MSDKPKDDQVPYRITIEMATDAEHGTGRTIELTGLADRRGDPATDDRDLTRMAAQVLQYQAELMSIAVAQTEVEDAAERAKAFDGAASLLDMPTSRTVQ